MQVAVISGWADKALKELGAANSGLFVIVVRLDEQKLYLLQNNQLVQSYPISSSRYGISCVQDSLGTPTGIHQIAEKIGQDCQPGEILKARVATGKIALITHDTKPAMGDVITSRILWLRGLESGLNQGEGVDSWQRYIYIHGTNEEGLIGRPASNGCIRMKNTDVIDLYDKVEVGTRVLILPGASGADQSASPI
jgi:lipoprotein-anchoring transpeptidase ErfK/SrfK